MRALSAFEVSHTSKISLFPSSKSDSAFPRSHQNLAEIGSAPMLETATITSKHSSKARDIERHDVPSTQHSSMKRAQKRVSKLRDRLYRQRLTLGEKRNELRQERAELSAIDAKFMNIVRQSWNSGVSSDTAHMESIYAELESKRDELGTMQYDYDTAEADHDVAEAQFEDEEQILESLIARFLNPRATSEIQSSETSSEAYSALSEVFSVDGIEKTHRDYINQTSPTDAVNDLRGLEKEFTPNSPHISQSPDDLAIELGVQDAKNNSISNTDEGRSDPSKIEKSNMERLAEQGYHRTSDQSTRTELEVTQNFEIRLETRSESALVPLQHRFDEARPQISWWILHTFGSSTEDYFRRTQLFAEMRDTSTTDEQWARLVFEYWKKDQAMNHFSGDLSEASGEKVVSQNIPKTKHSRRLSIGGSYLLLSSELAKAKYSLEKFGRLFPSDETPNISPSKSEGSSSPNVHNLLIYRSRIA